MKANHINSNYFLSHQLYRGCSQQHAPQLNAYKAQLHQLQHPLEQSVVFIQSQVQLFYSPLNALILK
jgi:hypothetical protein